MNKHSFLIIFLGLTVFVAGCAEEKPAELKFKNDVVTIENYFVSNVAPYEKGETNIQFELHSNGDRQIPYLEIEFFDIPGFEIFGSIQCPIGRAEGTSKCVYDVNKALEPLDVRSITIQLKSNEDVTSPTPHTVSFAVRYTYFGSRDVSIPVIDGETRKQPLTKLRQSGPSTGSVALDMDPSIEREIIVGDKTIKEYWAVGGSSPLPFLTKFKFRHVGSLPEKVKDVNITLSSLRLKNIGLSQEGRCDFCNIATSGCKNQFNQINTDIGSLGNVLDADKTRFYKISPPHVVFHLKNSPTDYNFYSSKSIAVPFDTLICTFKPNIRQPEYSASISAFFAYKYEFIKRQDFVVQPLPS